MNMLQTTYIISIIMILSIAGCSTNNIYQERKPPSQNTKYLKKNNPIHPKNTKNPNTKTQYGYYGESSNSQSFYNSLLSPNKTPQEIAIKDEVAHNNISTIKNTVIKRARQKETQVQINNEQPNNKPQTIQENTNKNKSFYLQIGAYSNPDNAINMQRIMMQYGNTIIKKEKRRKKTLSKVQIGPLNSLDKTLTLQKTLSKKGYSQTIVIKD